MLLEPLLRSITTELEPSTVVLAYDSSQSQWIGKDSIKRKVTLESWATNGPDLFKGHDFNVEVWDFSKQLKERCLYHLVHQEVIYLLPFKMENP